MKINEKIKELREKNGISQRSMAEYLGVDQSYISKVESDERNLSVELLTKISNLFICDIEDLVNTSKTIKPFVMPFRKKAYSVSDLENISKANKIILNFNEMIDMLEE